MHAGSGDSIIGIDWGTSGFRAYLIDGDGAVRDRIQEAAGVASLDRAGMAAAATRVRARWPDAARAYAAGMIGANIGWTDAGYVGCPAGRERLCGALVPARIGELELRIVPGLACVRVHDGAPDIMRGEETELFGLLAAGRLADAPVVALPGTHTKWVRLDGERVAEFMTAMSGELHDRLSAGGVLASVVEGPGADGAAFRDGVHAGAARTLGLGALLFGVRARAIREGLDRADASAYLRGLLLGAEIADALALFPHMRDATVPLVGAAPVRALYAAALEALGVASLPVDSADAAARGFAWIDAHRAPQQAPA